ncbi:MAG: hypothetical protein ABJ327_00085 [Litoreibacter sp.]
MGKTYLRNFSQNLGLILQQAHEHPKGEEGYRADLNRIRAIEREAYRITPLNHYIHDALRKSKPVFGNPPSPCTFWVFSKAPKPEPYFDPAPPYLYVDVDFAPEDLFTLGKDKKVIGELFIDLVEEALSKLKSIPGFPVDVIREGCEQFRKNDYTSSWKFGEKTIPGTKIKGRIDMEVTGAGTKRIFTLSYGRKTLIKQKISEIDRPDVTRGRLFDDLVLDGDKILVKPKNWSWELQELGPKSYYKNAKIDLTDYPEVLDLMSAKGWV